MSRHINKAELISKVRQLTGLTNDEKSALLELLNEKKTYGLVWENHEEAVEEQLREQLPVLHEVPERRIISEDAEAPNHIIIEAENLHALVALTYTHAGMIDVMYLDPPYNTGNGDFTYNDKIVDEEDSYRYSKWLSFMKKRLKMARELLSENGVIFISIDDYSQAQLKLLCDSVFDSSSNPKNSNFITTLIWNKQHSQQQGLFKKYHEYVLVYAKNKDLLKNVLSKASGTIEAGAMKKISTKNPASTFAFPAGTKVEAPDGTTFSGTYGDSEKVTVVEGPFIVENGQTVYPIVLSAGWTQKKQMQCWFEGKDTYDTKGQKVLEFYFNSTGKIKCRKERGAITPNTFLPEFGMGSEQTGHLEEIMGKPDTFTNPKPVEMVKLFLDWFCPADGTIMDFFAGSGTTLESTMQLNAEDGGHRQCILVTNNENGICEQVTYERNKRVIQGYTTPKGEQVVGLSKNNLRYYKADFISRDPSSKNKRELVKAATEMLCIKEGLYQETKMTCKGKTLRKDYARRFSAGNNEMIIIYEPAVIKYIVEELKVWDKKEFIKVYVFSEGRYAYDDDFKEVLRKVTLCALPDAIYQAYKRVLPRRKKAQLASIDINEDEQAEALSDAEHYSYKEEKGGEA